MACENNATRGRQMSPRTTLVWHMYWRAQNMYQGYDNHEMASLTRSMRRGTQSGFRIRWPRKRTPLCQTLSIILRIRQLGRCLIVVVGNRSEIRANSWGSEMGCNSWVGVPGFRWQSRVRLITFCCRHRTCVARYKTPRIDCAPKMFSRRMSVALFWRPRIPPHTVAGNLSKGTLVAEPPALTNRAGAICTGSNCHRSETKVN